MNDYFAKKHKTRTAQSFVRASSDEFYTYYADIEKIMQHYTKYLKDKIIFCPCDDPSFSQFIKYFQDNKEKIGYKKLLFNWLRRPIEHEFGEEYPKGDFRSQESIEMLKECDFVITNPPFSLVKELIQLMASHNKDFLLLGGRMILLNKNIKKLYFNKKIFVLPFENRNYYNAKREKVEAVGLWYTSLDIGLKPKKYVFHCCLKDTPYKMAKTKDYTFLNVDNFKFIPRDFNGLIGVSMGSVEKINTDEFDILDFCRPIKENDTEKQLFSRVIIKKR